MLRFPPLLFGLSACLPALSPGLSVDALGPDPGHLRVTGGGAALIPQQATNHAVLSGVGAQVEAPVGDRTGIVGSTSVSLDESTVSLHRLYLRRRLTRDDAPVHVALLGGPSAWTGPRVFSSGVASGLGLGVGAVATLDRPWGRGSLGGIVGLPALGEALWAGQLHARGSFGVIPGLTLDVEPGLFVLGADVSARAYPLVTLGLSVDVPTRDR